MLVAVAVGVWVTARRARPGRPAAEPSAAANAPLHEVPADGKVTLRFFRDPAVVVPVAMRAIDGQSLSSTSLRGKVVLVNFWATWCPPCRAEIPDLVALQARYRDQLQIIGVSQDEGSIEVVQRFAEQQHMNYPIVMMTPELEKASAWRARLFSRASARTDNTSSSHVVETLLERRVDSIAEM